MSEPKRIVFVCGDCAARLLERGAVVAPVTQIDFGHQCDVHPDAFSPQATNALELDGPLDPVPSTMPPPFSPAASLLPTVPPGTLTQIATRLLVAWSAESKGAAADDLMVVRAVDIAKRLLVETEGA